MMAYSSCPSQHGRENKKKKNGGNIIASVVLKNCHSNAISPISAKNKKKQRLHKLQTQWRQLHSNKFIEKNIKHTFTRATVLTRQCAK